LASTSAAAAKNKPKDDDSSASGRSSDDLDGCARDWVSNRQGDHQWRTIYKSKVDSWRGGLLGLMIAVYVAVGVSMTWTSAGGR